MLSRLLIAALSLFSVTALLACGRGDERARATAVASTLVDDFGDRLPHGRGFTRIASLNPSTTELLFAIGAGPRLVGRTHWDLWSDSARALTDLGNGIQPNLEVVLATRPDLVVLYASGDNRGTARRLRALGITTASFRNDRIADFARTARILGALTGDSARAARVVDSVHASLARVRAATTSLARPSLVLPLWESPLYVVGGGSFMNELIDIAGGRNVYAGLALPSPEVTFEDLVRRDPDLVLVSAGGRETIATSPRWQALRAVKTHHVVVYDTLLLARPSVRLGEAAWSLARLLHPRLVDTLAPAK